jgi:hypothetical protein
MPQRDDDPDSGLREPLQRRDKRPAGGPAAVRVTPRRRPSPRHGRHVWIRPLRASGALPLGLTRRRLREAPPHHRRRREDSLDAARPAHPIPPADHPAPGGPDAPGRGYRPHRRDRSPSHLLARARPRRDHPDDLRRPARLRSRGRVPGPRRPGRPRRPPPVSPPARGPRSRGRCLRGRGGGGLAPDHRGLPARPPRRDLPGCFSSDPRGAAVGAPRPNRGAGLRTRSDDRDAGLPARLRLLHAPELLRPNLQVSARRGGGRRGRVDPREGRDLLG